jgi:outer membrane protein insertion porin family
MTIAVAANEKTELSRASKALVSRIEAARADVARFEERLAEARRNLHKASDRYNAECRRLASGEDVNLEACKSEIEAAQAMISGAESVLADKRSLEQRLNLPSPVLQSLQNYTTSSAGFSVSASYPLHRSLKRVGISYSYDRSSLTALSTASQQLFTDLAFRGISGPNSLQGIVTSKIVPSFSQSTLDSAYTPHRGRSIFVGAEIAGIGGTVRSIRPTIQFKHFTPVNKGRNTIGFNFQGSFLTGYGGLVAPPFERSYLGGETDLRGFDIRTISPVAFLPSTGSIPLTNPDGSPVPKDPSNPLLGSYRIPIPVEQIVFPGGDLSLVTNLEYRITIAGPVALAPFMDFGVDPIVRKSQLRINSGQLSQFNNTVFGCPTLDIASNCTGGSPLATPSNGQLQIVSSSNWVPRISTGLELQMFLPIVNAPFRIYWAYNPLRLDTTASSPVPITRSMFPAGAAGDYTYQNALAIYSPHFLLREPRKTFRFTVATTF